MRKLLSFLILILLFTILSCKKEEGTIKSLPLQSAMQWEIQWISTSGMYFIDESGQYIQLRGINQRAPFLFDISFNDGREANEYIPPFTQEDVEEIARLGFNHLRLPINWSAFEPQKDVYKKEEFFGKIHEILNWCRAAGIYVLLDIHSDAWSKEIGEDGMPGWTIYPTDYEKLEGPINFSALTLRRANSQVFKSFKDLMLNNYNIRDEYMFFWNSLIEEFKDDPAIIGFEPLNEPTTYFGGVTERQFLNFYKICSQNMRFIDTRHLLWLEPDAARNIVGTAPLLGTPFPDDKIVYCPHYYPNLNPLITHATVEGWMHETDKAFDRIVQEGKSWNAPIVIDEWGVNPTTPNGKSLIVAFMDQMQQRNIHGSFWLWREAKPGTCGLDGTWGFFTDMGDGLSWQPREDAKKLISTPYAFSLPAPYTSQNFDRNTQTYTCTFEMNTENSGSPILYIPELWYPNGYNIYVNNKEITPNQIDSYQRVSFDFQPIVGGNIIEIRKKIQY